MRFIAATIILVDNVEQKQQFLKDLQRYETFIQCETILWRISLSFCVFCWVHETCFFFCLYLTAKNGALLLKVFCLCFCPSACHYLSLSWMVEESKLNRVKAMLGTDINLVYLKLFYITRNPRVWLSLVEFL